MMNFEEAISKADDYRRTEKSDGCTYAPELGITHWCERHDMMRRFKIVSDWDADWFFAKGIVSEGIRYAPVALIYWLFVRWTTICGGSVPMAIGLPVMLLLALLIS